MKLKQVIHTVLSRLLLCVVGLFFVIPITIFGLLPKKWRYESRFVFFVTHFFYWLILKCTLLPIRFIGAEYIPNRPVIFVANHQSSLDIPLLGMLARKTPHMWLATNELLKTLLLRWVVSIFAVTVDVSSPKKAMRSLRRLFTIAAGSNIHLMLFPEGGRYTDGSIHPFFGGFAKLAKKLGRPVVPIYITGVGKAYPPKSFFINYEPINVVVGRPFVYREDDTEQMFKDRVRNWFVEYSG